MINGNICMKKWWDSYTCISKKIETGGFGNDHADINSSRLRLYIEEFSTYIPIDGFKNVLNLGAGDGGETKLLQDRGYKVVGITMGIDNIKLAKQQYNIDLIDTDMNILDFSPNLFDAIFLTQTFEHFLSPFIACLEMWRVLRIGGKVYMDVPDPDDDKEWVIWHTNLLYPKQIIKMFELCGFKHIQDLNNKNRLKFIFEKISDEKIEKWGYLRFIHNARNHIMCETRNHIICETKNHIIEHREKDEIESFVEDTYLKILGRNADIEGRDNYVREIKEGHISREQLSAIFENSDEYKNKKGC